MNPIKPLDSPFMSWGRVIPPVRVATQPLPVISRARFRKPRQRNKGEKEFLWIKEETFQPQKNSCVRCRKKEIDEVPRKVTLSEYLSSPQFQRKRKIESERAQRSAFEKKMAFRSAQEQNPIKGTTETETRSKGTIIRQFWVSLRSTQPTRRIRFDTCYLG